jgi:hypothetical protein
MSNKLISVGLMLVLMWPLTAGDGKSPAERYDGPRKDMTTLKSIPGIGQDLMIYSNSPSANIDADIVASENDAMSAYSPSGFGRGTADTLAYVPADGGWNAYFYGYQAIGDAFMTVFQMPADGIIKGLNVPIYYWGTGDQQITLSLHKLSYPVGTDGAEYPTSAVDGAGWLGGYDMDANGWQTISGSEYSAGGTAGVCDPTDAVMAGAQDPLGTTDGTGPAGVPTKGLIWPDGFTALTANPESQPAEDTEVWYATGDYGSEPELMAGEWVGVLANATGTGGGSDPILGFYYEAADGLVDNWVGLKFYGECGGTSGNGGWHIRHWMFNMSIAVELTGDRGPVFGEVTALPTTLSTDARELSAHVTDDNPSGEAAGVSAVTMSYQLDSLTATVNSVSLSLTDGTSEDGNWSGEMPGAATGTTVYWSITAYDNNGNATSTAVKSYFIFQATTDQLIFDNSAALYGNPLYAPYLYYGWGLNPFDYWSRDYGNVSAELFENYHVVFERAADGADYDTDAVANPWYQSGNKVYVAEGDEWLGTRYGWPAEPLTLEAGSFARHLGVDVYHPDINGASGGISRLVPNPDDALGAVMDDYLDSNVVTMTVDSSSADTSAWDTTYSYASSVLDYDPNYDPGHSNWLDGVDPHGGAHGAYWAYPGVIDSLGNHPADATLQPVAVYSQHGSGSRGGLVAFDQMSLYARVYNDTGSVTYSNWIGPEDYVADAPGGLVKGIMDWAAGIASVDDEINATPETFSLKGNYPNPFNPSTNIMFTLGMENDVTVSVYSILGEEIATLQSGRMIPGTHSVRWNGLTSNGYNVASGVYFYQVDVAGQVKTGKMMLLK